MKTESKWSYNIGLQPYQRKVLECAMDKKQRTINPLPGFCVIELEKPVSKKGSIIVAEKYKKRIARIGRIGRIHDFCAKPMLDILWPSTRIIVDSYAPIRSLSDTLSVVKIEDIVAIIEDDSKVEPRLSASGNRRCGFCGPARSGSKNAVMLVEDEKGWYCPCCHQYENGEPRPEDPAALTPNQKMSRKLSGYA